MFTACLNRTQKAPCVVLCTKKRRGFARTGTLCPHKRFTLQVVGGFKRCSFTSGGWCCVFFWDQRPKRGGCLRESCKTPCVECFNRFHQYLERFAKPLVEGQRQQQERSFAAFLELPSTLRCTLQQ